MGGAVPRPAPRGPCPNALAACEWCIMQACAGPRRHKWPGVSRGPARPRGPVPGPWLRARRRGPTTADLGPGWPCPVWPFGPPWTLAPAPRRPPVARGSPPPVPASAARSGPVHVNNPLRPSSWPRCVSGGIFLLRILLCANISLLCVNVQRV